MIVLKKIKNRKSLKYSSVFAILIILFVIFLYNTIQYKITVFYIDGDREISQLYYDIGHDYREIDSQFCYVENGKVNFPIAKNTFENVLSFRLDPSCYEARTIKISKISFSFGNLHIWTLDSNDMESYISDTKNLKDISFEETFMEISCIGTEPQIVFKSDLQETVLSKAPPVLFQVLLIDTLIFAVCILAMMAISHMVVKKMSPKSKKKIGSVIDRINIKIEKNSVERLNICQRIFYVFSFLLLLVAFGIVSITDFLKNNFNALSFEEIVFHLKVPMEGTSNSMIVEYFKYTKSALILFATCYIGFILLLAVFQRVRNNKISNSMTVVFSMFLFVASIGQFVIRTHMINYIQQQMKKSTFIEENYVDPNTANVTFAENKRNLIYIYLESMESTFVSKEEGGSMDTNLLPELTKLAKDNINFSESKLVGGATSSTGSTWTVGAMVTQSTGLPLLIPIDGNAYGEFSNFLPGATSLGDILEKEGYNQEIMVGSDIAFGGRDLFYKQHGNYKIWDYNTAIRKGKIASDYYVWWGYEDKKLYEYAQEEITQLAQKEQPFNFTMLTVDTHHIDGYVCDLCGDTSESQYENVLACASAQVYDFVQWIQEQDFYENTTIVISGDHPTMDANYMAAYYDQTTPRKVYNCFINAVSDATYEKERIFNTFDLFPTTLAAMGAEFDGDRLGLGTNLFSGTQTLAEEYGLEKIDEEFSCTSKFYQKSILKE